MDVVDISIINGADIRPSDFKHARIMDIDTPAVNMSCMIVSSSIRSPAADVADPVPSRPNGRAEVASPGGTNSETEPSMGGMTGGVDGVDIDVTGGGSGSGGVILFGFE